MYKSWCRQTAFWVSGFVFIVSLANIKHTSCYNRYECCCVFMIVIYHREEYLHTQSVKVIHLFAMYHREECSHTLCYNDSPVCNISQRGMPIHTQSVIVIHLFVMHHREECLHTQSVIVIHRFVMYHREECLHTQSVIVIHLLYHRTI